MSTDRPSRQTPQSKTVVGLSRYVFVRAVVRTVWVAVSTLYAVCAYLLWCGVFLLPLRFLCSDLYWPMEAVLFRFLQSLVAHWMQTAGYTGRQLHSTCAHIIHIYIIYIYIYIYAFIFYIS